MNTYVMPELIALLAITAVAGILIGWCIKSLFSGRFERQIRANVARDVDEAAADVQRLRVSLQEKDADLQGTMLELQQLRGRDVSLSAGNTTQVEEINDLKVQLSRARQTLDQNRAEFAAFRDEKQHELQSATNQLASFKTGGSNHDKSLNQAHDSIAALRAAARENDKIIESLRARNKEADTTVENLRSQLKQSETAKHEAIATRQEQERATARLTANLQQVSDDLEKQKRDYSTMLENKNRDINKQMSRLEELGNVQSLLKQKEHDFDKLNLEVRETASKTGSEINELQRKLEVSEQALADSRTGIKNLQDQLAELTRNNKAQSDQYQDEITKLNNKHGAEVIELRKVIENSNRELQSVNSLKTQIENKDAEVVALNDMLRDISSKRDQSVNRINALESQLKNADALQQQVTKGDQQMEALAGALKQRENEYAKLRAEKEALDTQRSSLEARVKELEQTSREVEALRPQKQAAEKAQGEVARLNSIVGNYEGEIKRLKVQAENAEEQSRLVANLQTTVKQKDAEVQKLRSTGDNLSALNSQVNSLGATINQRDTDLADARLRVKNLTASLKTRDGEILSLRKAAEAQNKSQIEIDKLTATLSQRDAELGKLKSQITSMADERQQAATEIQKIKSEQATEKSKLQSSDSQRAAAYKKLQTEFDKISKARDEYEVRVADLQRQLDEQQRNYDTQLKQSEQKLTELQPQLGTLQTQVSSLASEKQQLTADLSDTETLKLRLTERDAEIKKMQLELKEAQGSETLQTSLQDQGRKVDSLTSAMRERDNEISRLNKIITENRVGSKQQSSEVGLLKEEINAQNKLIHSLQDQAENTLQLHKKIANQSTEIESLRADLHMTKSKVQQSVPQVDRSHEIAQLKQQLSAFQTNTASSNNDNTQLHSEISRLQKTLAQRDAELQQVRATANAGIAASTGPATATNTTQTARVVSTRVSTQPAAKAAASDKPRVFVRHGETHDKAALKQVETNTSSARSSTGGSNNTAGSKNTAASNSASTVTAENLAGTQMPSGQSSTTDARSTGRRRALYTGDGYRLKRPDGTDDLALLPGFNNDLADALRKNDVSEFEQIALWTQREVAHFADRIGMGAAKAEALQLPNAAKEILAGRFRVDTFREAEKN